jgi:hypothetical protein
MLRKVKGTQKWREIFGEREVLSAKNVTHVCIAQEEIYS